MSEKMLNTRIQQKHDIEVNWSKAINFIPKIGEVVVYDPDETHAAARVKIGDGVKTIVELPFISEIADWNVNDETSAAYVKNRTHYKEIQPVTVYEVENLTLAEADDSSLYTSGRLTVNKCPKNGEIARIVYNGVESVFKLVVTPLSGFAMTNVIGDSVESLEDGSYQYGFSINWVGVPDNNTGTMILNSVEEIISLKIIVNEETVIQIPEEYISYKPGKVVEKNKVVSLDGQDYITDDGAEIFNDLEHNKAVGRYSHAEGSGTRALGENSHAEGSGTGALGIDSHAEGYGSQAQGNYSHAEGGVTVAASDYQHVQGKYNLPNHSQYAHIVGNGTDCDERSNAHTLDWEGNAWFSGDVYIGSNSGKDKDEGSKKLATEDFVSNAISAIPTPDVSGQIAEAMNELRQEILGGEW